MESLQYIIPAVLVAATAFFVMYLFIRNDERKRKHVLAIENKKITTPVRLQAYERLILFLERISPEAILVRVKSQGMTSQDLQKQLLHIIRSEFEHNLSQQLYVSHEAWEVLVNAKEHTVKLINTSMIEINPKAPAMELNKMILESMLRSDIHSPKAAVEFLKKEATRLF